MNTLLLDGRSLSLDDLAPVLAGEPVEVGVSSAAREGIAASCALVDEHVAAGNVVYGLTTGFGKLKSVAIGTDDLETLQRNLVLSHSCGVGEPMPTGEVRVVQVLRLNSLCYGHSGVRQDLIDFLVRVFNQGLVPVVPQQGSVGASGDLAPLAHMVATYMGHGEAWVLGERMDAQEALRRIGEEPIRLRAKEGLALINGTEVMKAIGVGVYHRAVILSRSADAIASLSLEVLLGSIAPFDERLAELKGSAGHARTSANVRACLKDSKVLESHAECGRVQDPYSLRCIPQIHGAFKTALEHVGAILSTEINSVTDNPVLFPETGEILSAGQFHGQPISMVLDYLALSLCTLANVSERRVEQLVNPDLSGLPAFLAREPGLNSGFMIAHVSAASLASENKSLAHPASVDTIPTSANQEDHVSMGVTAARKARSICANTEAVLAIEWLCAAQGREFRPEPRAGAGAEAAYACLREVVPPLDVDRYMQPDIEAARKQVVTGELIRALENAGCSLQA